MTNTRSFPPSNAQRLMQWQDFPQGTAPAQFELYDAAGKSRTIELKKNMRRVFEALLRGPVYCASPVRISDLVLRLKQDHSVTIETLMYEGDGQFGCERYGVYFLRENVRRTSGQEAA